MAQHLARCTETSRHAHDAGAGSIPADGARRFRCVRSSSFDEVLHLGFLRRRWKADVLKAGLAASFSNISWMTEMAAARSRRMCIQTLHTVGQPAPARYPRYR